MNVCVCVCVCVHVCAHVCVMDRVIRNVHHLKYMCPDCKLDYYISAWQKDKRGEKRCCCALGRGCVMFVVCA
jgi:hypothetical protein